MTKPVREVFQINLQIPSIKPRKHCCHYITVIVVSLAGQQA